MWGFGSNVSWVFLNFNLTKENLSVTEALPGFLQTFKMESFETIDDG